MPPLDLLTAAIIVAVLVLVYIIAAAVRGGRDGFVSARAVEISSVAAPLFARGDTDYGEFKKAVPDADAALYADVRALSRAGRLNPAAVQSVL